MEEKKRLLSLFLIKDELGYFHNSLKSCPDELPRLRLIKYNFITLNTFLDIINDFVVYIKNDNELKRQVKYITKRKGFINHMRNKIGGHLDDKLLYRGAQWTPEVFSAEVREHRELQALLSYKTMIEASINSYLDVSSATDRQKEFGLEIDLAFESDRVLFFNYLGELNEKSISCVDYMISMIEEGFKYYDRKGLIQAAKVAGLTDFNIKKEFELPRDEEMREAEQKDSILLEMLENVYHEADSSKKLESLQKIINLLQDKIDSDGDAE